MVELPSTVQVKPSSRIQLMTNVSALVASSLTKQYVRAAYPTVDKQVAQRPRGVDRSKLSVNRTQSVAFGWQHHGRYLQLGGPPDRVAIASQ